MRALANPGHRSPGPGWSRGIATIPRTEGRNGGLRWRSRPLKRKACICSRGRSEWPPPRLYLRMAKGGSPGSVESWFEPRRGNEARQCQAARLEFKVIHPALEPHGVIRERRHVAQRRRSPCDSVWATSLVLSQVFTIEERGRGFARSSSADRSGRDRGKAEG